MKDFDSYEYVIQFGLIPYVRWHKLYWFCNEHFGEVDSSDLAHDNWIWAIRSNRDDDHNDIFLIFRDVEDYTLFKLMWEDP
jgi:hypothetical protein